MRGASPTGDAPRITVADLSSAESSASDHPVNDASARPRGGESHGRHDCRETRGDPVSGVAEGGSQRPAGLVEGEALLSNELMGVGSGGLLAGGLSERVSSPPGPGASGRCGPCSPTSASTVSRVGAVTRPRLLLPVPVR